MCNALFQECIYNCMLQIGTVTNVYITPLQIGTVTNVYITPLQIGTVTNGTLRIRDTTMRLDYGDVMSSCGSQCQQCQKSTTTKEEFLVIPNGHINIAGRLMTR